jgi:eukaryotic-like serine/threonine-protein kinase
VGRRLKTRLTFEPSIAYYAVWSPDSSRLFFASNRFGKAHVFSVAAAGVGQSEQLFSSDVIDLPVSWAPDGRYLALDRNPAGDQGTQTIWIFENFGGKKLRPLFTNSHPPEWGAVFSPDGKWLAYQSNESGPTGVYIVSFPIPDIKIQVSKGVSTNPRWSRDGKELFYLDDETTITVASLQQGKTGLQITRTTSLFKVQPPAFDISADGQRILVYKTAEGLKQPSITLITNWPSLLLKR